MAAYLTQAFMEMVERRCAEVAHEREQERLRLVQAVNGAGLLTMGETTRRRVIHTGRIPS